MLESINNIFVIVVIVVIVVVIVVVVYHCLFVNKQGLVLLFVTVVVMFFVYLSGLLERCCSMDQSYGCWLLWRLLFSVCLGRQIIQNSRCYVPLTIFTAANPIQHEIVTSYENSRSSHVTPPFNATVDRVCYGL